MNSTLIGQGGQYIGTEIKDEPLFQDSYGCPAGRWCRNSDAAFIEYDPGITKEYGIAFTGLPPCTGGAWCDGRLTVQGIVQVTAEDYAVMNEDLNKTGQRTGWTRGPVIQTCADTEYDLIFWGPAGGNIRPVLLCQIHVRAGVGPGDSGSPVYKRYTYVSGEPGYAKLVGVLWGRDPFASGANQVFYASPLGGIAADLGPFDPLPPPAPPTVTIEGPSVVSANTVETWTAVVSGGALLYAFQWYLNGMPAGNAQSLTIDTGGADFELRVDVTDGGGVTASATKFVTVLTCPPPQIQCEE